MQETAAVLAGLLTEGKIRAVGVSNFSPAQMAQFRQAAPIHSVQPPYNLFEREAELDVLPYAAQHDIAVLCYGALCRGLLAGTITGATRFEGDDRCAGVPSAIGCPRSHFVVRILCALVD
jgi:aryl-alcohol dehydrogenase-like predicted oxidoreductase